MRKQIHQCLLLPLAQQLMIFLIFKTKVEEAEQLGFGVSFECECLSEPGEVREEDAKMEIQSCTSAVHILLFEPWHLKLGVA